MMFKKEFLPFILSGRKTQTRRVHSRLLRVGRTYSVQINRTQSTGYYVKVLQRYYQKLGDITEAESVKEGFNNLDEFREAWARINGYWNPEREVIVYDFEVTTPPPRQSRLEAPR